MPRKRRPHETGERRAFRVAFADEQILPVQLVAPRTLTGERLMLLAVIEEALTCRQLRVFNAKRCRLKQDAIAWFADPCDDLWIDGAFGFRGICRELGWAPDAVLRALERGPAEVDHGGGVVRVAEGAEPAGGVALSASG